ncbi:MAG TPA: 3-hydroxyacyl-CoA dehydrogenase family protein [Solirubrobacteraceae bacterium]|nr:3-hydroxyacyl-CoA dehydrogenase family protein [Solirubrobacteraceae bacterium]
MQSLAVIGAGTMGAGIAQVAAMAGCDVRLRDVGESELDRAVAAIDHSLERLVLRDRLAREDATAVRGRITMTTALDRALDGADTVIEAVPEILELKHEVLAAAAELAGAQAVLATNTSQFTITGLAAPLPAGAQARVIGMHFFNPPVMMRLVELVVGERTSEATLTRSRELVAALGKVSVVCKKDTAGFITTRAYAALRLECLRIVEEGVASAEDVDTALKLGFNFPMGPFELADFNGTDISLHVLSSLHAAYGDRFRPTPGLRDMVAAGRLGRKVGEGFFRYADDGTRVEPDDPAVG